MAIRRRKARGHAARTPEYLAHEALGYALGRVCAAAPEIRVAVQAGYTRALRAKVDGGGASAARELEAAGEAIAAAHGIKPKAPRRRR